MDNSLILILFGLIVAIIVLAMLMPRLIRRSLSAAGTRTTQRLGRVAKGTGEPVECRSETESGVVVAGELV